MKKDKLKYIKPKKIHFVLDDIQKHLDKHINDKRSNDKFFFGDKMKEFYDIKQSNYDMLRSDEKVSQMIVYQDDVRFITTLLIQVLLFGRIIVNHKNQRFGITYNEELPTLPKNHIPLFMKPYDENGKVVDNEDLHTLNIMKQYYQLDKVVDKDEMLKEITNWITENQDNIRKMKNE